MQERKMSAEKSSAKSIKFMSNIGRKPVQLKPEIQVKIENGRVFVSGPKGNLQENIPQGISVEVVDNQIKVSSDLKSKENKKFFGLTRSLIFNMVKGVDSGFEKKLELSGVGYRAKMEGNTLVLNVGYAIPVKLEMPEGIVVKIDENIITVYGIDKQLVGNTASIIRKVRPPDPYKAKGIKYQGERIRRKVGKVAKAGEK